MPNWLSRRKWDRCLCCKRAHPILTLRAAICEFAKLHQLARGRTRMLNLHNRCQRASHPRSVCLWRL